ncbi:MAG TPA: hypothetical protein VH419_12645 [Nocardioidaceae bacterium]|jgi:hypothetical protein
MNAPDQQPWHVDDVSLRRWVEGTSGAVASVSVEEHVLRCERCQAEVADLVPTAPLQPVWDNVLAGIEIPHAGLAERLLRRLGLRASDALVIGSAVALRAAWLSAVIAVLFFTVVAGVMGRDGGLVLFLMAAPLIPISGVAAAYGPSADPSYDITLAAPYAMVRLVLLRTAYVLVTSVPLVVVAGLLLPTTSSVVAVAWLLPAAGFVVVVLSASNWVDPAYAAATVAVGWIITVAAVVARSRDPLEVFAPIALVTYLAIIVVAGLILLQRLFSAVPSWRLR